MSDPRALRNAFGAFITGVTVVTMLDETGAPRGFTANSFTSVSLNPPLLLVCIAKSSSNLGAFETAAGFAVNILSEAQQIVSQVFSRPAEDRFAAVEWRAGPRGAPILAGVAAWFDCAMHERVDAGDHVILIGRVEAFDRSVESGLGYADGGYFSPTLARRAVAAAASHAAVQVSAIIERDGAILLTERSDGAGLGLPRTALGAPIRSAGRLRDLFDELGVKAAIGFIYAVYEDDADGAQHIAYRCVAAEGDPTRGEFHPLAALPFDQFADQAEASMLRRFVEESRIGHFGVYFGDQSSGRVEPLAEPPE